MEGDKVWTIELTSEDKEFLILLQSSRYDIWRSHPAAFYLALQLKGDRSSIAELIRGFLKKLGRHPLEKLQWSRFLKSIGAKAAARIKEPSETEFIEHCIGKQKAAAILPEVEKTVEAKREPVVAKVAIAPSTTPLTSACSQQFCVSCALSL